VTDYSLTSSSVVLVRYDGKKATGNKNLTRIWDLARNKPEYCAYIESEIKAFMAVK
jgi:hypothetical protein